MKRWLLALALLLAAGPALAQNTTCATRPDSDSSNACASTKFVKNVISGGGPINPSAIILPENHIIIGNSSNVGADGTVGTGLESSGGQVFLKPSAAGEIGGVNSAAPIASQWIDSIGTNGLPHLSQPTIQDIANGPIATAIDNVVDLKALTTQTDGETRYLQGYYSPGDGGGGNFVFSASSSTTPDDGVVIEPNSGVGRWLRLVDNNVASVVWWGAKCDGTTDDYPAFNAAIVWASASSKFKTITVPPRVCGIGTGLVINSNFVSLVAENYGHGNHNSGPSFNGARIKWQGATGGTVVQFTAVAGGSNQYLEGIAFEGISISCATTANPAAIGLQLLSVRHYTIQNVSIEECTEADFDSNVVTDLAEPYGTQMGFVNNIVTRNIANDGIGVRLDGGSNSNTSFNVYQNFNIVYQNGAGILLLAADNNQFNNFQMFRSSGGTGIGVDISGNTDIDFPAQSNHFYGLSSGDGGVTARGTELLATPTTANTIYNYDSSNSAPTPVIGTGAQLLYSYDNGNGNMGLGAWTAYTPTMSCTTGSGTFASPSGLYNIAGKTVMLRAAWQLVSIGTCSGRMIFSLPQAAASTGYALVSVDNSAGTFSGCITESSPFTTASCLNAVTAGHFYSVNGVYQAN